MTVRFEENSIRFNVADQPAEDRVTTILPVLEKPEADTITAFLRKPEMRERLQRQLSQGTFSGKTGSVLDISSEGLILIGVGKAESFHPDNLHSSLLKFASNLKDCENKKWILAFSQELVHAMENYGNLYSNPELDPLLAPRATRAASPVRNRNSRNRCQRRRRRRHARQATQ